MQVAESSDNSRVGQFNALYAYHRALTILTAFALVLFAASFHTGFASRLTWRQDTAMLVVLIALLLLFWHRTKRRAFYYAREVLLCAERQLPASASVPAVD